MFYGSKQKATGTLAIAIASNDIKKFGYDGRHAFDNVFFHIFNDIWERGVHLSEAEYTYSSNSFSNITKRSNG